MRGSQLDPCRTVLAANTLPEGVVAIDRDDLERRVAQHGHTTRAEGGECHEVLGCVRDVTDAVGALVLAIENRIEAIDICMTEAADTRLRAQGLGAYIADAAAAGDFHRIALGIATMSLFVVVLNRVLWRPLYFYAERKFRLA